jgi:serine/threonine-protein phosphatase 2B catalytic subunit
MTEFFTFRDECLKKFDLEVYECFNEAFDLMPVAAVINNDYLCVHGGISPHINNVSIHFYDIKF